MNCSPELLEAYMDGELDPGTRASVEEHLSTCEACSTAHAKLCEQKAAFRSAATYYAAPPQLEHAVRGALRQAAAHQAAPARRETPWRWLAIAASILLAVSASWNLRRSEPDPVAQSVLSGHIRSLMGTHLLDVPSTDQHTVKPWFNGKLDFSPNVKDLAPQGFPLIGGRVDYLADRAVAALVFQRRQHVINLFTWPAAASRDAVSSLSKNGYNVLHWTDGAATYWAVSDVAPAELEQFETLYRK
jgi:anti-sigma factor RsiW